MTLFNGSNGNDIFTGGSANDTAVGNAGNDTLSGAGGNDLLVGGSGSDTLNGGAGEDRLYGGEEPSSSQYASYYNPPLLDTGTEKDTLSGGDGSDIIFAGYGDNVDGGTDGSYGDKLFISFLGAASGVTVDFHLSSQTIGGGTIKGIENVSWIQGSNFADYIDAGTIFGSGYSDFTSVLGMGGNDQLIAGYYTSTLDGGDGDDIVDGRESQYLSEVFGGNGDDTLYCDANGISTAFGGGGNDTIYAATQAYGGDGNDRIVMSYSYYGSGYVYGEAGDDQIDAGENGGRIAGGSGADTLNGNAGADQLNSAEFDGSSDASGDDAGLEKDVLAGFGANDILAIGYGDSADGGSGNDTLRLSMAGKTTGTNFNTSGIASGQTVTLGGGIIQHFETFEYLRATDYSDTLTIATQDSLLTVVAGAGNDVITSQSSSVNLNGGDGNDLFISGIAGDVFDGGRGTDTVDYRQASDAVTIAMGPNGISTVGSGGDELIHVENVFGSIYGDVLSGNELANELAGQDGNDQIAGGAGNDTLHGGRGVDMLDGGQGADKMDGGTGNDVYHVGNAFDEVIENASEGTDTVLSTISYVLGANVENLQLAGEDSVNATGNSKENLLVGNAGANTLDGRAGSDIMQGGAGNDSYYVRDPGDQVIENASEGNDTVLSSISYVLGANIDSLRLLGSASIDATGNARNNLLVGNSASNMLDGGSSNDRLKGGAGNDTLLGGKGADELWGGTGADEFAFAGGEFGGFAAASAERIHDFSHAEGDRIDLVEVDANSLVSGDQAFTFIGGQSFHHVAGELRMVQSASYTYVYGDDDGDGTADFLILLDGQHALTGGDFIL